MRIFELHRERDISGISGVGVVAEGVVFTSGKCALHWLTKHPSIGIYKSIKDVENIHGHDGSTKIVYLDTKEEM